VKGGVVATETGITQAEFAKRRGVSEAMVSRWKSKGYLVLDGKNVLEAASNARLSSMLDPARGGDRSGKVQSLAKPPAAPMVHDNTLPDGKPEDLNYQREAARDKRASAKQRELDLAKSAGELVLASDVEHRIAHHVRGAIDHLASRRRRLAPKLALEADPRKVEQLLEESDREFCTALAALAIQPSTDEAIAA
jgi:phage terminase Nu1 subunit (DNA packaging protein)